MSGLRCIACGSDSDYGARFCERCGAQLLQRCSHCGHRLTRTALFCSQCGASVDPVNQNVSVESVRTDPERRQLTVMFCDLVGSTALSARLDPEDMRIIISSYRKAATKAVQDYDGFVARYMGDGILAYFGYPKAHEHDAEHAVQAGLAITEVAPTLENAFGETLHVRVGIATGIVVVGDIIGSGESRERDVVGDTPNLAARLQGIAKPDSVVIAEATRRLIGDLFQLNDLGTQELKGIASKTRAFEVVRARSVESRFKAMRGALTPLVGRDEEIKLLLHLWGKAKDGEGQVALLSGEAGIGKTRLVEVLKQRAPVQPSACSRISMLTRAPQYGALPGRRVSPAAHAISRVQFAGGETRAPGGVVDRLRILRARSRFADGKSAVAAGRREVPEPSGQPRPAEAAHPRVAGCVALRDAVFFLSTNPQR